MKIRCALIQACLLGAALLLPAAVQAQFFFVTNNGAITITGPTVTLFGAITIPSTINGYPVVGIADSAFGGQPLSTVTIPDSVTNIGNAAFLHCGGLTSVTFGTNVISIGDAAFSLTSLTNVTIPDSVIVIGNAAFSTCPMITSLTIGTSVTSIGQDAFETTSMTNVTIPNSVTSIGTYAFSDCSNLTSVTIGNGVTNMGDYVFYNSTNLTAAYFQGNAPTVGGVEFLGDPNATVYYLLGTTGWGTTFGGVPAVLLNPPYNYTTNNATITITGYTGSGGAVAIPSTIHLLPVTSIGSNAFYQCSSLTNISIPISVTNIGSSAFSGCSNLTSLIIPTNVIGIGDSAFSACIGLTGFYFQGNAPNIGSVVFDGDTNATVYYLLGTTGWSTPFGGLPAMLYNPPYNYMNANFTITITGYTGSGGVVDIPSTISSLPVTSIGSNAFYRCSSLTNITIPNSVTNIGSSAFFGCSNLTSVAIPNSLASIGTGAFSGCKKLTSVAIPNSLNSISDSLFLGCSSLTNVIIPNSVTNIGKSAFAGCSNLKGVYIQGNAPSIGLLAFYMDNHAIAYYLAGTTGWVVFSANSGLPTVLWLPRVQTNDGSFGVQAYGFGFNITWASGQTVVVEVCTNLANPVWLPVATNTLTGSSSYFSDPQWTNNPSGFYRLRSP